MALAEFNCTNCGEKFKAGSWHCASGEPHIVAPKTYYVRDAPADKRDCKNARLQILNVIPERVSPQQDGTTKVTPGTHVEFIRGRYETSDPQLQMILDKRAHVNHGEAGLKQWEQDYFSDAEKAEINSNRLRGEVARLESERNDLLEQVKKTKKAG